MGSIWDNLTLPLISPTKYSIKLWLMLIIPSKKTIYILEVTKSCQSVGIKDLQSNPSWYKTT